MPDFLKSKTSRIYRTVRQKSEYPYPLYITDETTFFENPTEPAELPQLMKKYGYVMPFTHSYFFKRRSVLLVLSSGSSLAFSCSSGYPALFPQSRDSKLASRRCFLRTLQALKQTMFMKIVQPNEEVIKSELKELVRGSAEETPNEFLEKEADPLTRAALRA